MSAREVDRVIERLAMLASGAKPIRAKRGICFDVSVSCGRLEKDWLYTAYTEMGLHGRLPLGRDMYARYGYESAWNERRGKLRRDLCKRTVFHLVRVHGYQGDWA